MDIVFEDEEVTFTFEGKDYSAMVDFYDQDEWKICTVIVTGKHYIHLALQKFNCIF